MKKSKNRTPELTIAGNYSRKRQEIAIRNFSIRNIKRVELSCPENRRIEYGLETEQLFEWKGVDSEWKSGQLECPKGSFRDFDSRDKNLLLLLKLIGLKTYLVILLNSQAAQL